MNPGLDFTYQILEIAKLGELALGTAVASTLVSVGTTTNTVSARAQVVVDFRARTIAEQDRVHRDMAALFSQLPGSSMVVERGSGQPPLDEVSSNSLFARASELANANGLGALLSVAVGGASDGNFTAGIVTPILDGLGAVGRLAHGDDERAIAEGIPDHIVLPTLLIAEQMHGADKC